MAQPSTLPPPSSLHTLSSLSDELILLILSFLDVPDLLAVSRTTRPLRTLSLDPLLHAQRLSAATSYLSTHLPHRPSLSSLRPPTSTIYLSRTHIAARALSRQLIAIRLQRNLARRPEARDLVECNILPPECWRGVAPGIVGARRSVERERVKDSLRGLLEGKIVRVEREGRVLGEEVGVGGLVRRFTAWRNAGVEVSGGDVGAGVGEKGRPMAGVREMRWGRGRTGRACADVAPTRAHVLGLRRFWEGMSSGAPVSA